MRRSTSPVVVPLLPIVATAILSLTKLTACGDSYDENAPAAPAPADPDAAPPGPLTIAPGPSRGSAIAISPDDSVVVAVNRASRSVSVFGVLYPEDGSPATLAKRAEIEVGAEPWQVVISPDGDKAFVVVRKDQKLVKLTGLKSTPKLADEVELGSEPTAVALTPGGTRAWVANWVDGTLVSIDTRVMSRVDTIDLNQALVETSLLGAIAARPALAHPRSIAITNDKNGDEDDESIYVTEYYAQRTAPETADGSNADVAKSGIVYKVKIADKSVSTIRLAPIADIGFKDSNDGTAGCYPNQLQSITIQDRFAFVSSICASPKGPVGAVTTVSPPDLRNVKTTTHTAVSVIDLATDKEVPSSTATLHHAFDTMYNDKKVADDGSRRYPAVPSDIGFVAGGGVAYVTANAADAVFRVRYDVGVNAGIVEVGAPTQNFIELNPAGIVADKAGLNPNGIATPHLEEHKRFAFVVNEASRNVSVLDFNTQTVAGGAASPVVARSSELPAVGSADDKVRRGKRFFDTATGRWSLKGQGWNGCQACHMDGLSDNVTWFFARGPRQSTSLDGSFSKKDPTDQRIFNWTAIFDEVSDFEGNTRGISGGVGAIVHTKSAPPAATDRIDLAALGHASLAGSAEQVVDLANPLALAQPNVLPDWEEIKAYVQRIRAPRKPTNLDAAKVAAGRKAFVNEGLCQGCHGGDKWTISRRFFTPSTTVTDGLAAKAWAPPAGFPVALLPAADQRTMRFANGNPAAFDQIQCVLRPVGTFGVGDAQLGHATEVRQDMTTPAQGNQPNGNGFNPPSLLGMQVGAPYFHGGGAATLEALFAPTFKAHYQALAPNLLTESDAGKRAARVEELVSFLLSIDETAQTTAPPATAGATGGDFCAAP